MKISGDGTRYNHRDGNDDTSRSGASNLFNADRKKGYSANVATPRGWGLPKDLRATRSVIFQTAHPGLWAGLLRHLTTRLAPERRDAQQQKIRRVPHAAE